nr:hypothetical protein [Tanacetum cinerariifolium]
NQSLSAELLGANVSEDTFAVRMAELMNQRRNAIAKIKAKAKRDKPMTRAQQRDYMRTFVKNQSTAIYTTGAVDLPTVKTHHHHFKRSGDTLESSESQKLKYSQSTEQPADLQQTLYVSDGSTIATGAPISAGSSVPAILSVSTASSVPAETPIAAGVFPTAASGSPEQTVPLRKSSRKKSMARRRTLPIFDDYEPAKPVSLALVSDVHTWEIIPTELYLSRADLMVLYGMVSDKYKLEKATNMGLGLWSDLWTLITAREDRDVSIIWDDQD